MAENLFYNCHYCRHLRNGNFWNTGCDSSAYRCFREFHYSFTQSQSMYYRYFSSCLVILVFVCTNIGDDNQYIRKMRSAFRPSQDASYQLRVDNRKKMRELMIHKPFGYGIGLSKGDRFYPKERMPYPPDSWLVSVWVETGIIGLVLYLAVHGVLLHGADGY